MQVHIPIDIIDYVNGIETAHVSYTFALNNGRAFHVIVSVIALWTLCVY